MSRNRLLEQLRQDRVLLGLCNMYPAAGLIEGMCKGWDFVWIDGQHGAMAYDSIAAAVRAAQLTGVETIIRVPGHEPGLIGPYADLAPSAVMVPMVNTAEQAETVSQALRFPPNGQRSYGGRRVIDLYGRDYYTEFEMAVIAQIETRQAAENAAAIINTEGIDLLFFGPDDMKVSLGLPINTSPLENEQLREAMRKTADAARSAGKFACCVSGDEQSARAAVEMGYQVLVGGGDIAFLRVAAANRLTELRRVAGEAYSEECDIKAGSDVYGG
ncbi:MAG: HpcH/HpaI aldolase family protein [bacterium]